MVDRFVACLSRGGDGKVDGDALFEDSRDPARDIIVEDGVLVQGPVLLGG